MLSPPPTLWIAAWGVTIKRIASDCTMGCIGVVLRGVGKASMGTYMGTYYGSGLSAICIWVPMYKRLYMTKGRV